MERRTFLKYLGGFIIASSSLLAACTKKGSSGSRPMKKAESRKEDMTYRTNPNTGDKISLLGYGMMRLPVVGGGTEHNNPDAELDQDMINLQVDYAISHGLNFFDTSPAYCRGLSERATGIALSRHKRSDYFISTKLSNFAPETQTREGSIEMFENSIRELQVDYIDYYLLHSIGGGNDAMQNFNSRYIDNGILDWLVEQKRKGRIRNLGFSYHGDISIFDMLLQWMDEGRYHWDFVLIELNYLDWEYANEINPRNTDAKYLYNELHKRGIPALVMEPLLGGRLANVPDAIVAKMKKREPEMSVASWAFRFAGTPEGVLSVLSGMTYMHHLKENLLTYSPLKPLSDEEKNFLQGIANDIYNLKTIPCNECNYCMPCPYGINIPGVLSYYNRCIKEMNIPQGEDHPDYRRARRAFLVGYDRSIPYVRQANHCIGCAQCNDHCPQRINIPMEMQKIDSLVERLKQSIT